MLIVVALLADYLHLAIITLSQCISLLLRQHSPLFQSDAREKNIGSWKFDWIARNLRNIPEKWDNNPFPALPTPDWFFPEQEGTLNCGWPCSVSQNLLVTRCCCC